MGALWSHGPLVIAPIPNGPAAELPGLRPVFGPELRRTNVAFESWHSHQSA